MNSSFYIFFLPVFERIDRHLAARTSRINRRDLLWIAQGTFLDKYFVAEWKMTRGFAAGPTGLGSILCLAYLLWFIMIPHECPPVMHCFDLSTVMTNKTVMQ